jgi:hypothetical protein
MQHLENNTKKPDGLEDQSNIFGYEESLLAVNFPEEGLSKLATFLLDAIDEDIEARKDWMDAVNKAQQYLGLSEDLSNTALKGFARTFDTTTVTALFRFYATTSGK